MVRKMSEIIIAENAGFCFGVKRAVGFLEEALERSASTGEYVCTLGKIIHNDKYMESVKERGAHVISADDLDDLQKRIEAGEKITLIIRAHGEKHDIVERLSALADRYPDFSLYDGTCPFVEKVRERAKKNTGDGKFFILIGSHEHPEVLGIMSCTSGDAVVIRDSAELEEFVSSEKGKAIADRDIYVAAQTTMKLSEWKKCLEIIKKVYTSAQIFDTICSVTEQRQNEARRLAAQSDITIVIGSEGSSNSHKLYEVTSEVCPTVYFVDSVLGLDGVVIPEGSRVTITAGASTPYSVIQEVCSKMSEQVNENFAEMLESSIKTLTSGDVVEGVVSSVTNNEVHVDLGTKTTGVIPFDKAVTEPGAKLEDYYHVGDTVTAKVIKVSDVDGIATLDKNRVDSDKYWNALVDAEKSGEILEGKITNAVNGGVIITINSAKAFIPAKLTGVPANGDLNTLVGTTQRVKIIEIKKDKKRAYASISAVLREERKAKEKEFWDTLEVGKEFDGEVKGITSYGAFVNLGPIDGMVHNTELSWKHIKNASEVVSIGEIIHVFVKSFDPEKKRVSLGYKTEDTNPWTIFTNKYEIGDSAEVRIVSLMPFGAFAEIVPGVDGLIHISQITDHRIQKPDDILAVGDVVTAQIIGVDVEKKNVSLSIRALMAEEEADEDAEDAEYDDEDVDDAEEAAEDVAEEAAEEVVEEAAEEVAEEAAEDVAEEATEETAE